MSHTPETLALLYVVPLYAAGGWCRAEDSPGGTRVSLRAVDTFTLTTARGSDRVGSPVQFCFSTWFYHKLGIRRLAPTIVLPIWGCCLVRDGLDLGSVRPANQE